MIQLNNGLSRVLNQLIDMYCLNDTKLREQLLNNDAETIRELGKIGVTSFSSDEILSIFDGNDLDIDSLNYLKKLAKKRKIANIIYRIIIGELSLESTELEDNLKMINIKIDKNKKLLLENRND